MGWEGLPVVGGERATRRRSEERAAYPMRIAEGGDFTPFESELLHEPLVAQGVDESENPVRAERIGGEGRQGERRQVRDRRHGNRE